MISFDISGSQIDGARDYQEDAFLITHLGDADAQPRGDQLFGGEEPRRLNPLTQVLPEGLDRLAREDAAGGVGHGAGDDHRQALAGVLARTAQAGAGVVLVVHDLAIAMNHAHRVVVLDRGTIAADGPPGEALAEEVLRRVWQVEARWLGTPGARALGLG